MRKTRESDNDIDAVVLLEQRIGMTELVRISGLSMMEVEELVDFGVFAPEGEGADGWLFTARYIAPARTARRLRRDFGLNASGIALALTYLERIRELENRLRALECGQPRDF